MKISLTFAFDYLWEAVQLVAQANCKLLSTFKISLSFFSFVRQIFSPTASKDTSNFKIKDVTSYGILNK